jgi:hypothetical protein
MARSASFRSMGCIAVAVLAAAGVAGCGADPAVRAFPYRSIAWQEHDSEDVPRPPRATDLADLDATLLIRDDIAGEVDRAFALEGLRPARDVNASDEVPCSTWFCPRNHLRPVPPAAIAVGPPGSAPRLPLHIVKGKDEGDALGFQVRDADGRKFLLKLDPAGHLGMSTAAEVVGARLFHAAGYNVPANFVLDLGPDDLVVDPGATFKLYRVQTRPLTAEIVRQRLTRAARTPDGRLRAVAVSWIDGKVLGAFDMQGRRADDPNDRIPHEDRRSLRATWLFAAWLAIYDASAINTLDSFVEDGGRHFVRHYLIDFGAGLGSGTRDIKGPQHGGQYLVEFGRSLASMMSLGLYRRPYQSQRADWNRAIVENPTLGWFPAEDFDVEAFRPGRKVPAHRRLTDRDAYWGAKLVTSFSDAQLIALAAAARLEPRDAATLAHALGARRDIIGRRYLTAMTAVEAPAVVAIGGDARVCFDDLVVARRYAGVEHVRYDVQTTDDRGRSIAASIVPAQGARSCVAAPGALDGYRVIAVSAELATAGGAWRRAKTSRIHVSGGRVVGLERDE